MTGGMVYAFRVDPDHVKIGSTKNLNSRRQGLQGAHHHLLELVDSIEHDEYKEGERYLHQQLAPRRTQDEGVGSREHFRLSDEEVREAFNQTRRYLDLELPRRRELPKYESLEAGEDILPATEEMLGVKRRSDEVRATRASLQAEMDALDNEATQAYQQVYQRQWSDRERLNRLIHQADVEEADLETTIKLAIGAAAGIAGVATWKSVRDRRRRFDPEWVKADDPELFDAYRTAFDAARFKKEQPSVHEAHMRVTTHREFEWVDEVDPGTVERAPGGDQPEPQPVEGRVLRMARPIRRRQR